MLTFNLPCKPYTKRYLENCFGSPAYLRQDSAIGKYFFQLVGEPTDDRASVINMEYTQMITIQITEAVFLQKGYVLSKTNIQKFNRFVEDHFKTQIHIMLNTLVEIQDIKIKDAIDFVYDKFDMDETFFPLETIVKDYYRYRKSSNGLIIKR